MAVERAELDGPLTVEQAATILRGGAWIGALERLAIFAGLVASWPEAIAIVLAVKGLGRYPELRSGEKSAVAERFIIGTLVITTVASLIKSRGDDRKSDQAEKPAG